MTVAQHLGDRQKQANSSWRCHISIVARSSAVKPKRFGSGHNSSM
jgi:hypothetical protein